MKILDKQVAGFPTAESHSIAHLASSHAFPATIRSALIEEGRYFETATVELIVRKIKDIIHVTLPAALGVECKRSL
jgi:hypothetical protein